MTERKMDSFRAVDFKPVLGAPQTVHISALSQLTQHRGSTENSRIMNLEQSVYSQIETSEMEKRRERVREREE